MKKVMFKLCFIYLLIIRICQTQEDSTMMTFEPDEYESTIFTAIPLETTMENLETTMENVETTTENVETSLSHVTTMTTTTTTTTSVYTPNACNNASLVALDNGTCVTYTDGQIIASNILNNNGNASSTTIADALVLYFQSIANGNGMLINRVSPRTIDNVVSSLSDVALIRNSSSSFLVVQQGVTIVGASFIRGIGGNSYNNITSLNSTVAAILNDHSPNAISLNMLIIDKPTIYVNIDNSTVNKSVVSSIIIAAVKRNSSSGSLVSNISLYFTILPEYQSNIDATYYCSFYDTNNYVWNETGCTSPQFNSVYNRYECNCNHSTTFALTRTSIILQSNYLTAQEIASLVCLSFSILCFILALIFIFNPIMFTEKYNLLPLISTASTTILFIFYIALTMTVYTRMPYLSSSDVSISCFTSSSTLMFFVYFFLIFMFCVKTSILFHSYLRFIRLFPEQSYGTLIILLSLSFFMAIAWTSFAAGFNSNSSFSITQLQGNQLCWFTQNVVYYFVLIPVSVFIILTFLLMILIVKHIIHHKQRATSPHQSYERIKLCVLILLISSITQGIAWLFGPYISFVHVDAANVLGWFFVIFNGLEGVWTILLCAIIYLQHRDEQMRTSTHKDSIVKPSNVVRDMF